MEQGKLLDFTGLVVIGLVCLLAGLRGAMEGYHRRNASSDDDWEHSQQDWDNDNDDWDW